LGPPVLKSRPRWRQVELRSAGECALCKDGKATRVVVPCGHLCLCKLCASDAHKVTKCPICRYYVSSIEKWGNKKRDIDASEPTHGQHRESTHDDTVNTHTHRIARLIARRRTTERQEFLMRVPFDENSIEDPLMDAKPPPLWWFRMDIYAFANWSTLW